MQFLLDWGIGLVVFGADCALEEETGVPRENHRPAARH